MSAVDELIQQCLWQHIQQFQDNPERSPESSAQSKALWVVDENLAGLPFASKPPQGLQVLTNRYDVYQQFRQAGWPCEFNDFDFSALPAASYDRIYYRVSKEKAVVNWLINSALTLLKSDGRLVFVGAKNEGTKTYFDKSKLLFDDAELIKLGKGGFEARLTGPANGDEGLDDRDYTQLRAIPGLDIKEQPVLSKPGVFGWDKIDAGSAFLIEQLPAIYQQLTTATPRVLDLGCGYGYLSVNVWAQGAASIVATDNNAAAVLCCQQNFTALGIEGEVVADNCAAGISGEFDLIVCNPPFHQGFSVEGDLTNRFIASAKRLLAKGGQAVFVVNRFIPLEKKAKAGFSQVQLVAENSGFKVIRLSN